MGVFGDLGARLGGEIDFEAEVKCAYLAKLPTRNFFFASVNAVVTVRGTF